MNSKLIGIILLVVGLGVGLYFVNSGVGSKFEPLFSPPGATTSTATTTSTSGASSGASSSASSSAGFSWSSFFKSLFAPRDFSHIPTVPMGSNEQTNAGSSGGSTGGGPTVTPPAGYTVAQLSPYYKKVYFNNISRSQITLTTYGGYNTPTSTVDITGWEIKTNRGGEFIPQVTNVYYPVGQGPVGDVVLTLNATNYVNIYSNSAPTNLRINSCMGYLNTPSQFSPGFSSGCPAIDRSGISQFTGACQDYILSLGGCQSPNFGSRSFPKNDYQCESYLQGKYTYNWCVSTYAGASDFLKNEWRIWMGSTPLDPSHDNVELLDGHGLLVDLYTY